MSKDRDSQWQQQKTDEVSTFEHSGFTHSSTLDSRLDKDKQRPRPSRTAVAAPIAGHPGCCC